MNLRKLSRDERVQVFCILLVPAFVGHTIQLLGEDTPWAPHAWSRYWFEPGWHLYLPPLVPLSIALGLAISVLGIAVFRTRPWVIATIGFYGLHYLTYPYRIRNHMTHMGFGLLMLGALWFIGRRDKLHLDRHVADGLAAVLCVTYFFAGFHKINTDFLSLGSESAAANGIELFFIYGDLGHAPTWAKAGAAWGTVLIECLLPVVAWRVQRLRVLLVLVLFAFHLPMVSVMNVSDYPMIVSIFYVALFSRAHFRLVLRYARRPSRWNVSGTAIGVAAQLWFMPWWGALTIFGIFVMGLWGWAAGSMLEMQMRGRYSSRGARAAGSRSASARLM